MTPWSDAWGLLDLLCLAVWLWHRRQSLREAERRTFGTYAAAVAAVESKVTVKGRRGITWSALSA
jgi:hypothetical protein